MSAAASALALALALVAAAGCSSTERLERAIELRVETVPAGATVVAFNSDAGDPRVLGTSPLVLKGLVVVRKRFLSDEVTYWLRDRYRLLPPNRTKPPHASPAYSAGANYPLTIILGASVGSAPPGTARIEFDQPTLRALFEADPVLPVTIRLAHPPGQAARASK